MIYMNFFHSGYLQRYRSSTSSRIGQADHSETDGSLAYVLPENHRLDDGCACDLEDVCGSLLVLNGSLVHIASDTHCGSPGFSAARRQKSWSCDP